MSDDKIRVLITLKFEEALIDRFNAISSRLEILHRPARSYTDIITDVWESTEILYTAGIFPPQDAMPTLKWIQSHRAGVDQLLSIPLLENHPDVQITSMRGIHATNIAEYVMGFLLMFGHRVPILMRKQTQKAWEDDRYTRYMPKQLRGATVGIVGYGAIGREIARLVKAFGGYVLAAKRDAKTVMMPEAFRHDGTGDIEGDLFDRLYPPQALATMVKDCDFVVVTVPYTPETKNLYDERVINAMKKGSFLVNIGRGGVVDEEALFAALESRHLGGAAMDVFAEEPLPESSPLWTAPNMIITPHIAGNMDDYDVKASIVFEDNLRRYVEGKPLMNLVNRELGY